MAKGWQSFSAEESVDAARSSGTSGARPRVATKLGHAMPRVELDGAALSRPSGAVPTEVVALGHESSATQAGAPAFSPAAGDASSASASASGLQRAAEATPDDPGESGARGASRTRVAWIEAALRGDRQLKVALVPGKIIPGTRYRIRRWLGEGAMGVVYEAEHVDIERKVALKILRAEVCEEPFAMKAFRDEARVVGRIGAEQIVDIFDFGELPDGRLMFAMEMVEGAPLFKLFEQQPLPAGRAIGILRQLCKGLAAAHDVGIIHRDVKPDNILVGTRRGRGDAIKILDFGIATILAEQTGASAGLAGTPYYLAPEIIRGLAFDGRADLYAVGCTAYEMLYGRPPFYYDEIEPALKAHLDETPAPPEPLPEGVSVPQELLDVVMRCLAKKPGERYQSMAALELALCRAQLAAGVLSEWDDLPLPEVEPEERAQLLAAYAKLGSELPRERRAPAWWMVAAALAVAGLLSFWLLRPGVDEARVAELEQLTAQARASASRALFVYPPLDDRESLTAYAVLKQIDALGPALGRRAKTRAQQLREDFAATLVRLGDEYWARPGGRGFAVDYYAQALLFDPDNKDANSHVTYTPGQLAVLRDKVERDDFTERDLFIAQTLQALAEQDPEARAQKIAMLQDDGGRAASTKETLAELLREDQARADTRRGAAKPKARKKKPRKTVAPPSSAGASADAGDTPAASTPAPKTAKGMVKAAKKAMSGGRDREAQRLFERALGKSSKNTAALIGLSDLHFNRGEYSDAVTFARRAVKAKPRNASYRIKLGDAYYKLFRYEEAREHYAKAKSLGHEDAARRLAKVEKKLGG